jgi:hypothetical protein
MNRSLVNMELLNLDSTINDCDSTLLQSKNNLLIINKTNTYIHQNKIHSPVLIKQIIIINGYDKSKSPLNLCVTWKGKIC